MEIAVKDLSSSLGGGGRYDNLIGMFLGRSVPASGLSLGLDRIVLVMKERGLPFFGPQSLSRKRLSSDVMVTLWEESTIADALAIATELRGAGLTVDVYPDVGNLKKQLKYASDRKIPFVVIVGPEERQTNSVTLKDLNAGTQWQVKRSIAAAVLRDRLRSSDELSFRLGRHYDLVEIADQINRAIGRYEDRLRYLEHARPYLQNLQSLIRYIDIAFLRPEPPEELSGKLVDSLNRLCVDEFSGILTMCFNGHGNAAIQIIRGMYEKVVTSSYLHKHPNQAQNFISFWSKHGPESEHEKPPRKIPTWKSIYEMAKDVGLDDDYRNAWYLPGLFHHPTSLAITSKLEVKAGGIAFQSTKAQQRMIDIALPLAHVLIIRVLDLQFEHFELEYEPGLQSLIDTYVEILQRAKTQHE